MTGILHWSRAERVGAARILAAAIGLAVPVVAGAATGHTAEGMTAAMGGLASSGMIAAAGGTLAAASGM